MKKLIPLILLVPALSACGSAERLSRIGRPPRFSAPEPMVVPATERSIATAGSEDEDLMSAPRQRARTQAPSAPTASLFRSGAGALFRDQRASQLGDILTIRINIADKAAVDNTTSRSRTGSENAGVASLLGLTKPLAKVLPGNPDLSKAVDASSTSKNSGAGSTNRSETIDLTMAAVVTDVLPNGNLVIKGRQEVRVNFELRELVISGIVRPQDIARDNSIQHSQIAEARISYGGRGQLTDAQQARWAQQIYDALFPF